MKNVNLTGLGLLGLLAVMASCNDGMDYATGTGTIAPLVDYDPTVISARSASKAAAEIGDLTVNDLTLTLVSEDGKVNESFPYADFPADRGFAVGKYTLSASYGDPEAEGFECPAVHGSAELSVNEGKTTPVSLTATPSKAMVTIKYADDLTDYMTSCSARLHTPGGAYVDYTQDETRPVYLRPGRVEVSVSFVKPNGKGATVVASDFTAEAKTHYTLTLKFGGDGAGEINSLIVSYDETLTEEDVIVDISDAVLTTPAPVVTPSGFADGDRFNVIEGSELSAKPRFDINARGGIAKAILTTTGQSILDLGWPAEVDLANCPAAMQATLKSLGFKDLGILRNPGTLAAFDLSSVAAHIPATASAASPVTFTLVVTDKNGKESDPLGFSIKIDKLELTLAAVEAYTGTPTVNITATYNGTSPLKDAVTFEYLTNRGVYAPTTVADATVAARALETYNVTVNVPSDARTPLTLRASCGSVTTESLVIPDAAHLSVNTNDVFAKSAWIKVEDPDAASKTIKVFKADGTELAGTQSGREFHITEGLTPGTANTVYATVDGLKTYSVTFTTEADTALPNGNLNDGWSHKTVHKGATSDELYTAPNPWDTVNEVTMQSNSYLTNSYCMLSATINSDDARDGKAALIRTVGHGITGAFDYKPSRYTAGELYLGTYNGGAQYGIDFASRPSALSFWYKYTRYTAADRGLAEIKVYDASGNIIASGSKPIDTASEYTNAKIDLTYTRGATKAAKIEVNFKSLNRTPDSSSVERNGSGQYSLGSALYIDDVELVY